MEKINIFTYNNKYYYRVKDNNIINFIISEIELYEFNFDNYLILLITNNLTKYSYKNNIIYLIRDIDINILNKIEHISKIDLIELAKIIGKKSEKINSEKINNNLKYIIKKETFLKYKNNIKPYIESIYKENTSWIRDIIEGKREKENILYIDQDILILKELSMINNNTFYILGFPIKKITCIREIKQKDIPILDKIINKMNLLAKTISNINQENLYHFFHYHPSFYHLHIHCTFIENNILDSSFLRRYLYNKVKDNILKSNTYFKKTDLYFEIPKNHIICNLLEN